MNRMIRLWKSEHIKSKRSFLIWIHLFVPIVVGCSFLVYGRLSQSSFEAKWEAVIQLLAIGFPFMISIVVSIAVDQERQSGFAVLLAGTPYKLALISVKIVRTFCLGSFSLAFAMVIFVGGMYDQNGSSIDIMYFIISAAIIMLSVLLIYIGHWLIDLRFSRNYSIALGLAESLIAAVFMTGLGEGYWPFTPSSWPVRYISYYMIHDQSADPVVREQIIEMIVKSVTLGALIVSVFLGVFFFWFKKWEGENMED